MATQRRQIFGTPRGAVRLQENDRNMDYDGGRVVLVADQNEHLLEEEKVQQLTAVINYRKDGPMEVWPLTREERRERRFTIEIWEEDVAGEAAPPRGPGAGAATA